MEAKRDDEGVFTVRFKKPKAWDKLKDAWNDNPMLVITVGTGAVAVLGKFIEAVGSYQSKRAYAKQFNGKKHRKQGDDE